MAESTRRKQSLYFPEAMLRELEREAQRLGRSTSWVITQAWRLSRVRIARFPGANDPEPPPVMSPPADA